MERIVPMPPKPNRGPSGPWGRRAALAILDSVLSQELNKRKLRERFEEEFVKDPIKFYLKFAFPLMPKEQELKLLSGVEATQLTPDQVVLQMDVLTQTKADAANPNPPTKQAETAILETAAKKARTTCTNMSPEWNAEISKGHPVVRIPVQRIDSVSSPQPVSRARLDRIKF